MDDSTPEFSFPSSENFARHVPHLHVGFWIIDCSYCTNYVQCSVLLSRRRMFGRSRTLGEHMTPEEAEDPRGGKHLAMKHARIMLSPSKGTVCRDVESRSRVIAMNKI